MDVVAVVGSDARRLIESYSGRRDFVRVNGRFVKISHITPGAKHIIHVMDLTDKSQLDWSSTSVIASVHHKGKDVLMGLLPADAGARKVIGGEASRLAEQLGIKYVEGKTLKEAMWVLYPPEVNFEGDVIGSRKHCFCVCC